MDEIDFWDRKSNNFTLQKFKSESIKQLPVLKPDMPKLKFTRVIPSRRGDLPEPYKRFVSPDEIASELREFKHPQ